MPLLVGGGGGGSALDCALHSVCGSACSQEGRACAVPCCAVCSAVCSAVPNLQAKQLCSMRLAPPRSTLRSAACAVPCPLPAGGLCSCTSAACWQPVSIVLGLLHYAMLEPLTTGLNRSQYERPAVVTVFCAVCHACHPVLCMLSYPVLGPAAMCCACCLCWASLE